MKRKTASIRLSDIVSQFSKSLEEGTDKAASDIPGDSMHTDTDDVDHTIKDVNVEGTEVTAPAPEKLEDVVERAEDPTKIAQAEQTAPATELLKIAQEAIEREASSIDKEASEFGRLFAHGFMEELNKTAEAAAVEQDLEKVAQEAYEIMTEKIAHAIHGDPQVNEAMAKVAAEAYGIMVEKIAQEGEIQDAMVKTAQVLMGVTEEAYNIASALIKDRQLSA